MVGIFIAIAACIYFFVEANKRKVSPYKWAMIAFAAFFGPQILLSWIVLPIAFVLFGIPIDDSTGIQVIVALTGFVLGFWLLVVYRKKLYRHARSEPPADAIVIGSLEIAEKDDGTFAVGDRVFQSRKDAEDFVDFTKSIRH